MLFILFLLLFILYLLFLFSEYYFLLLQLFISFKEFLLLFELIGDLETDLVAWYHDDLQHEEEAQVGDLEDDLQGEVKDDVDEVDFSVLLEHHYWGKYFSKPLGILTRDRFSSKKSLQKILLSFSYHIIRNWLLVVSWSLYLYIY